MKDYKTLFLFFIGLFIIYWLIFVLTPKNKMSDEEYKKINQLNNTILEIKKTQEILDNKIDSINLSMNKVDQEIDTIKNKKTIINKFYHEKIINVTNFSETELDSFFTDRYK